MPSQRAVRVPTVGVTGSPGTGKKSVSPLLAALLGMDLVEINTVARTLSEPDERGEVEVDPVRLRAELRRLRGTRPEVVSGHLLAEVVRPADVGFVAVLRCEPRTLKRRLASRGYPGGKVLENVEAELIGVVLDGALRAFGPERVHEYDTTHAEVRRVAEAIARDVRAGLPAPGRPRTDWTLAYDSSTKLRSLLSRPRTEPAST
ncbi:MAG: AAA family ATPase [Nitrososphaerales archaeon]